MELFLLFVAFLSACFAIFTLSWFCDKLENIYNDIAELRVKILLLEYYKEKDDRISRVKDS